MNKLALLAVVIPAVMLCGCRPKATDVNKAATPPATQPTTQPSIGRVNGLIRDLRGKDPKAQLAAIQELRRMGQDAMPALVTEYDDSNTVDSQPLLRKLSPITADDVPWLIEWLNEGGDWSQQIVLTWLAELGPKARAAVPAIVEKLKIDSGYELNACAAQTLKEIGPEGIEAALAYLKPALKDKNQRVRYLAADSLHVLGLAGKAMLPDLQAALSDDYLSVRESAAETLGDWGPQAVAAAPALMPLLKDESIDVRHKAAVSLSQMGRLPAEVVRQLPASMMGQDDFIKLCIAVALVKSGQNDPWVDRIIEAASKQYHSSDHAHYDVHMLAVKSFGEIGPVKKQVIEALVLNLIDGEDFEARKRRPQHGQDDGFPPGDSGLPWIRMEAAKSLGCCGVVAKDAIRPLVKSALEDDELNVREQSALAIGCIGVADEGAIEAMRKLAKFDRAGGLDRPSLLTAAAGFALARMGKVDEGLPAILAVLGCDDVEWQVQAAELLGKLGPAARSSIPSLERAVSTTWSANHRRRFQAAFSAVLGPTPAARRVPWPVNGSATQIDSTQPSDAKNP